MAVCLSVLMLFPGLRGYAMYDGQPGKNENDGIEMQDYSTMHSNDDNDNKVITSHGGSLPEPGNINGTAINALRENVKILKNNSTKLNCITSVKNVSKDNLKELTAEQEIRSDKVFTSSMIDFFSFPPTSVEELGKMSELGEQATEFYSLANISQIDVENDIKSVKNGSRNCGCCSPLRRRVCLCGFSKLFSAFAAIVVVGGAAIFYVCRLFKSSSSEDGSKLSSKERWGLVLVSAVVIVHFLVVSVFSYFCVCRPCCNGFGCCCGKKYNFLGSGSSVKKLKDVRELKEVKNFEYFEKLIGKIAFDSKKPEDKNATCKDDFLELKNWLQPKNLMVFIPLDPKIGKKDSSLEGKEYILSLTNYLDTSHDYIIPKLEEGDMRKIQESVIKVLDGDGVGSDEVEKIVENIRSVDSSMRKIQKSDLEVIISNWLYFLKSIKNTQGTEKIEEV